MHKRQFEKEKEIALDAFDKGNYSNAYITEDYELAFEEIRNKPLVYKVGHITGFFSSFKFEETPFKWRDLIKASRIFFEYLTI